MTTDFTANGLPSFVALRWTAWPLGLVDTDGNNILDTVDDWLNPTNHPLGVPVAGEGITTFTALPLPTLEAAGIPAFVARGEEE